MHLQQYGKTFTKISNLECKFNHLIIGGDHWLNNISSKDDKTTRKGLTISKKMHYNTFIKTSNKQLTSKKRRGDGGAGL
jgi:hypothetical protein